jgi:hypothetical protein
MDVTTPDFPPQKHRVILHGEEPAWAKTNR